MDRNTGAVVLRLRGVRGDTASIVTLYNRFEQLKEQFVVLLSIDGSLRTVYALVSGSVPCSHLHKIMYESYHSACESTSNNLVLLSPLQVASTEPMQRETTEATSAAMTTEATVGLTVCGAVCIVRILTSDMVLHV